MSAEYASDTLKVSFYERGEIELCGKKIEVETDYPFNSDIRFTVKEADERFKLSLRIPAFSKSFAVKKNGKAAEYTTLGGYITLTEGLCAADEVTLALDMPFKTHISSDFDPAVSDYFAITRGPIVFATEDYENNTFCMNKISEYGYEGIQSHASLSDTNNNSVRLYNYASVGIDWSKKMTVWLKR